MSFINKALSKRLKHFLIGQYKVVLQWQAQGTHIGEGMGEPTRHQFHYVGISIARIVDGKITDFWKKDNSFQVWQQHLHSSTKG